MEEDTKVGEKRMGDFLYSWKIFYPQEQQVVIDRFSSWCKERGYRQISGLITLLEMADHYRDVADLATNTSDLMKKIVELEARIEALEKPKLGVRTLGGA